MTSPATTLQAESSVPPRDRDITLMDLVSDILRHWRLVVALPLVLAFVAGLLALNSKRFYQATASFVPQMAESRGLSGAAALAQQFGVNLGTDRPGQSPQFYEDLLRTRTILRRAVESEYDLPPREGGGGPKRGTLITYWRLDEKPDPTPPWRRASDRLRNLIGTSVRRETGVIGLSVASDQPVLVEQIATRLLDLLNDYNLEARQGRAREESRFISGRLQDAQAELRAAEDALGAFLVQNRDFRNSPALTFQHDRLQRQVTARQEVYASLLRGQEQARLEGMRDTPVLQIIDPPSGSLQPRARKVVLRTVIAFLVGFFLAVAFALTQEASRRARQRRDPSWGDFEKLVRQLWADVRHPRYWLRGRPERAGGG